MPQYRIEDLEKIKREILRSSELDPVNKSARITVHMGTCGISSGAAKILKILNEELGRCGRNDIFITTSGCAGICNREPLITVERVG